MNRSEYNKNYWIENKSSIKERRLKDVKKLKFIMQNIIKPTKKKEPKNIKKKKIKSLLDFKL